MVSVFCVFSISTMYAYLVNLSVMIQIELYTIFVAGSFEDSNSITKSKAIDFYKRGGVVSDFMSPYEA